MTAKPYRAEIKLSDRTITVEGPKEFVEGMVTRYSQPSKVDSKHNVSLYPNNDSIHRIVVSERELIAKKQPKGHPETVAVLAFALTEGGTAEFTEEDIRRAYIRAGVRPPKVVAQALRDAKNRYDYLDVAGKRGRYRLTNHGDRVVRFDLPRSSKE